MLKAHGFDKANNQLVLETFTDIAIRYLNLLVHTVKGYMELRDDCIPNIRDITKAFLDLKIISPSKRLDKYDIDPITDIGIENFEKWFNHDMNTRMREVARPDREFLEERRKIKIKSYAVNSKMDNLTKALDEQSKQAQLQNPTMPYLPPPSVISTKATPTSYNMSQNAQPFPQVESNILPPVSNDDDKFNEEDDYEIPSHAMDEDWIQYLIRDQIASYLVMNRHNQQNQAQTGNSNFNTNNDPSQLVPNIFKGTVLQEYVPDDLKPLVNINSKNSANAFLIAGPMPENLLHTFPYYKSDDESSDFDSSESGSDDDGNDDRDDDDRNNQENEEDEHDHDNDNDNEIADKDSNNKMDVDNNVNSGLAAYDYYEHHNLYDDEMEDLDLYGQGDSNSNGLNLFG
jgi:transcription initiation factor TFIID subunit 3